jgi:hypothetical protein
LGAGGGGKGKDEDEDEDEQRSKDTIVLHTISICGVRSGN